MKVKESHTILLTPMKDGRGGIARPIKMERATLEFVEREADKLTMVRITNRAGEQVHFELDAVLALNNLLNDMLLAGKLEAK